LSCTLTLATPLPDVIAATTSVDSSFSFARSSGKRTPMASGRGRAYSTARTSCWTTPSPSIAVTTSVFWPSRSLSGRFSGTARSGVFSSCRTTSTPLIVTVTRLTPRPPDTTPASATDSWSTRTRSLGEEILTSNGVGGAAATAWGASGLAASGAIATGGRGRG